MGDVKRMKEGFDPLILREELIGTFQIGQKSYTNIKQFMTFNTLNYTNGTRSRYPGLEDFVSKTFLTPGDQTRFSNNFRTRQETTMVSWNGGETFNLFTLNTMVEVKLYLSNRRIIYTYQI